MRRPQVSLNTLLWLMAVVAAFLGGSEWQKRQGRRRVVGMGWHYTEGDETGIEQITYADGLETFKRKKSPTKWHREGFRYVLDEDPSPFVFPRRCPRIVVCDLKR